MALKKATKRKFYIAAILLVILGLLVLFLFSGENRALLLRMIREDMSSEAVRETLGDLGIRGYITVTILSMLQVLCTFLPAEPTQVLAGALFGFPMGLLCCLGGVFLGNTVIFLLQKFFGDKLRSFFMKTLHLNMDKIARSHMSSLIILVLYFLPVIPYGMIAFFAASIGIRSRRYTLITMVGALPSVCIGVALGCMAVEAHWLVTVCILAALVVALVVISVKRNALFEMINRLAGKPCYTSRTVVRKSGRVIRAALYRCVRVYYRIRGLRIRAVSRLEKPVEGPAIVLCNHGSFIDFVYAETLLRRSRPHFVVARLYFYHALLGKLLKYLGCFPKSMFALDTESTKNCLRVLSMGGVLAMMPEARLSTAGRFEDIQPGTFSFLKKAGVNVYSVKLSGDYLADPKWGSGLRRGARVEAELDLLLEAEQLKTLSPEQIRQKVEQRLDYDEFQWLETRPDVRYRCRNMARGLENILFLCPKCGQKHTLVTEKAEIRCRNCGKLTTMDDRYGFPEDFRFRNFAQWYDWQKQWLREQILQDPDYTLTDTVELRLPGEGKTLTRHSGRGVCALDRSGLRYRGTKDGEDYCVSFPLSRVYRLLFGAGENFEIYNGTQILYFVPEDKRSAVDWYLTSMILYDETVGQNSGGGTYDEDREKQPAQSQ